MWILSRESTAYDFGRGTFDISVISRDGSDLFVPVETDGAKIGGNNITDVTDF